MIELLEACPLDVAAGSTAAWLWEQAARDGEHGIRKTVARVLPLVRLAARGEGLDEWQQVLELMRRHFAGEPLRSDVRFAHESLEYPELEEESPQQLVWLAGEWLIDAYSLATDLGRNGDWWADCASVVKWSMAAAEQVVGVLQLDADAAIAICQNALSGTNLDKVGRELEAQSARKPIAANINVPDAVGSTSLADLARPLLDHLPARATLAWRALDDVTRDPAARFALAMGVMLEAFLIATEVREGTLACQGREPTTYASAIWHVGEVCALVALASVDDRDHREFARHREVAARLLAR